MYRSQLTNIKHKYLKELITLLPEKPGIYQYFNSAGKIIYVGKAKNLKKRVASYFNSSQNNRKTNILVKNISDIKYLVVETEEDALLLENSIIKMHQPKYNIRLKDDKTYPWIVIKNEFLPRVFQTRNMCDDGSIYFGPYSSSTMVKTIMDFLKKNYKIRTCQYKFTKEGLQRKKYKVCLEYHLGNCMGPCVNFIEVHAYNEYIKQIKDILNGDIQKVIKSLQVLMNEYSNNYQFEMANEIKIKLEALLKFQTKSTVVNPKISDVDVFSIDEIDNLAFINYLKVINGTIVQTYTLEIKKCLKESKKELLEYAIIEIRKRLNSDAKEILVPMKIDISIDGIQFKVPMRSDKLKLLQLSQKNAQYSRLENQKRKERMMEKQDVLWVLKLLQKDLQMNVLPRHIECFDNSNLHGTNPVSSCVVFKDAKSEKKEYRHFNIKTVVGSDDYRTMEEVIKRRYSRMNEENLKLPDLVIIDGGKGQLKAAINAFSALGILGKITVIGIAKKLEEIYFPDDNVPLYLDKNSKTLRLIQRIRDEAHRFAINFHKQKRSNELFISELESIKGIGVETIKILLEKYKSIDIIKQQDYETIKKEIGKIKAISLFKFYNLEYE